MSSREEDHGRIRTRLLELSGELLECETPDDVARVVTDAADDVLGFSGAGVRLHDPEADCLRVAAMGGDVDDQTTAEDRPTVSVEATPQGKAFREDSVVVDEIEPGDRYGRDVFSESLYVGIGEYGVLCAGVVEQSFSTSDRDRAKLLAAMAETAFRRLDRRETLERHSRVLETVEGMVWALDAEGQFTLITEPLSDLLGYERAELLGEHTGVVLSKSNVNRGERRIRDLLRHPDQNSAVFEAEYRRKDGSTVPVEIELSVLTDDGSYEGCVGVVRDITERRKREQYLQVVNRVLRHNLRNDLTVVMGLAEGIASATDDEALAGDARELRSVAAGLVELSEEARRIESLLDRDDPETARIDPVAAVEDVLEQARAVYPDASLSLSERASPTAAADDRLIVAVAQLVENAIEHNDGTPTVDVSVAADDAWVAVTVADDGPGIPPEEYAVITGERDISQLTHTSGLGLWLVRWAVDGLDGEVTFDERAGGGSEVTVRVPLAPDEE